MGWARPGRPCWGVGRSQPLSCFTKGCTQCLAPQAQLNNTTGKLPTPDMDKVPTPLSSPGLLLSVPSLQPSAKDSSMKCRALNRT
jgi:hypothetical protein